MSTQLEEAIRRLNIVTQALTREREEQSKPKRPMGLLAKNKPSQMFVSSDDSKVCIYHCVRKNEDYATALKHLHSFIVQAEEDFPGAARHLYLDIDGHEEEENQLTGFDAQMDFLLLVIMRMMSIYLHSVYTPRFDMAGNEKQENNIPGLDKFPHEPSKAEIERCEAFHSFKVEE